MCRHPLIRITAAAAICLSGVAVLAAKLPVPIYSITDLGTLGGERSTAMGVNNRGAVVGFSQTTEGVTRAFLYTGGSLVDLGTMGGAESFAYRINDDGIIVGRAQDATGRFRAFVTRTSGGTIELAALDPRADGDFGAAHGISSAGQVAGYFTTAGEHMAARNRVFLYRNFQISDIGAFGGEDGVAVAINDRGSIAGYFSSEPHADYAQHQSFLLVGTKFVPIGSLGGKLTTARDMNGNDEVVGDGDVGDGEHHAFVFSGGVLRDLGTLLGGRQSAAYAINVRGEIVGFSEGADRSAHAVLISSGIMRDLTDLIPRQSGWVLTEARDINDAGQIVGTGWLHGQQRGFLLTP